MDEKTPLVVAAVGDDGGCVPKCDLPWYKCRRYWLAFYAFLGFFNVYALRVNLSVAIVEMSKHFDWNNSQTTMILSSFFFGYICTQLPGGWLGTKFGGKYVFGFGVLCTTLLTLLTPLASNSIPALIALRVVEGLGEGVTYPAMHSIWAKWAPPAERSRLATLSYIGAYMGTIVSMPASGALSASHFLDGWPSVFYVFGTLGFLWFVMWMYFAADNPSKDKWITDSERDYIEGSIIRTQGKDDNVSVPWKGIFSSLPVWSIVVNHTTNNWGFYTLLTCLPTYLNDVLHFDISSGGGLSALPYLSLFIIAFLSGQIADTLRSKGYSTTIVRKGFNTLSYTLGAGFLLLCGYTSTFDHSSSWKKTAAVAFLVVANGSLGFALAGFNVNHLDISPRFAGVLMGITNGFGTIPGFVGPIVAGAIAKCVYCDEDGNEFFGKYWEGKTKCPGSEAEYLERKCTVDDAGHQWRIVFIISAAIFIFGALVFLIFGSGNVQPFNSPSKSSKRRNEDDIEDDMDAAEYSARSHNRVVNATKEEKVFIVGEEN
eukprot:m.106573 g.106573  ORF g.106573 m.106573 type:complete len:542 (-) comp12676_c0_seq1:125-1750(-)